MFAIVGLTAFVAICRRAIAISEKLSLSSWKLLSHLQFTLLILCLLGLQESRQDGPPVDQGKWSVQADSILMRRDFSVSISETSRQSVAYLIRGISFSPYISSTSPVSNSKYEGYLDVSDCNTIFGWAADRTRLNTATNVNIYEGTTLSITPPQNISIYGSNFQSGLTVQVRPYVANSYEWAGSNNLWTYEHAFSLAPSVSHISPLQVPAVGQSFTLAINGSRFDRGGYVASVVPYKWGGVDGWALYGHLAEGGSSLQPQVVTSILSPSLSAPDLPDLGRIFDRRPTVVVHTSPAEIKSISQHLLHWAQFLGALMLPFGLISTNILGWVLYNKSRVEARMKEAEHRIEMEKMKLEIQKLTFEVAKARNEAPGNALILLSYE